MLLDNRWRLVSLVLDGESIDFGGLGQVSIALDPGRIRIRPAYCNTAWFPAFPMPNNTFRVGEGNSTYMLCGEEQTRLNGILLVDVIPHLTAYEMIDENKILLTGSNVAATLEIDTSISSLTYDSSLPPPFQNSALLDRGWKLASVVADGAPLDYGRIAPVDIEFYSRSGFLLSITDCKITSLIKETRLVDKFFLFDAMAMPDEPFHVVLRQDYPQSCGEEKDKQVTALIEAMGKLTAYEIIDENKVLLTGDDVTATLELDTASR